MLPRRPNRPPMQRCSICLRPNILTKYCPCRREFFRDIPQKFEPDSLRLEGSPARLTFDVVIGTDVIPAITTLNNVSIVNRSMVHYLQRLRRYPGSDNTINVTFRVGHMRHTINCVIRNEAADLLSIGLSALLDVGMEFSLGGSVIRGNHQNSKPVHSRDFRRSNPYKVNRNARVNRHVGQNRRSNIIRYIAPPCSENWDDENPGNDGRPVPIPVPYYPQNIVPVPVAPGPFEPVPADPIQVPVAEQPADANQQNVAPVDEDDDGLLNDPLAAPANVNEIEMAQLNIEDMDEDALLEEDE